MKRNILRNVIAAAAVCATAFVAPSGAEEPRPRYTVVTQAAPGENADAQRVKALEKLLNDYAGENASLKLRVKELEDQLERSRQNRGVNILPGPLRMPSEKVPPDWKPFQFNGATYYIIPCDGATPVGSSNARPGMKPGANWNDLLSGREVEVKGGTLHLRPAPRVDERPAK